MSDDRSAKCKFISSKTIVVPKPGKFPDVDNAPIKSDTSGTDNIEDQKYQKQAFWPFKKKPVAEKPAGPQVGEVYTGGTLLESEEDVDAHLQPMMAADIDQFLQENPNASFEDFLASPRGLAWLDKKASADPTAFAAADLMKKAIKQAAWYDYLNPVNYVLPGGPSQVGAERDRGNKLDAEIAAKQPKKPKKPAAKASVENVNRQIDKGGLTAGSYRR